VRESERSRSDAAERTSESSSHAFPTDLALTRDYDLLRLQRSIGNRRVRRLLTRGASETVRPHPDGGLR
jgi:hypothetical protein